MLRPLLLLFALTAVPGAAGMDFSTSREFDISSCPITYFGRTYTQIYVDITDLHFVICFDGFYNSATSKDCVIGPAAEPEPEIFQDIVQQSMVFNILIRNSVPTVQTDFTCYVTFALGNNFAIFLVNFGPEAVVGLSSNSPGTTTTDVRVNGNTVSTLSVTNTETNGRYYDFKDVSGCRYRGLVYRTSTTTVLPDSCETVYCSPTAVLNVVSTCGPTQTCLGNNMCSTTTFVGP